MSILPVSVQTIFVSEQDKYSKNKEWTKEETLHVSKFVSSWPKTCEHRVYSKIHACDWKFAQGLWAALQTILSLGLALISDYTRRTWQQSISGKEWVVVHLKEQKGGGGDGDAGTSGIIVSPATPGRLGPNKTRIIPPPVPVKTPTKPTNPTPLTNPSAKPTGPTPTKPTGPQPVTPTVKPGVTTPVKPPFAPTPVFTAPALKPPGKIINVGGAFVAPEVSLVDFTPADRKLYLEIEESLKLVNRIEGSIGKKHVDKASFLWKDQVPVEDLIKLYNDILNEYKKPAYQVSDGYNQYYDAALFNHQIGDRVESYFANYGNVSTGYSRRFRSIAGMAALSKFGPEILDEISETLFHPNKDRHPPRTGLHKMHYLTGNAVDLEWPLFPKYNDAYSGEQEATQKAVKLINAFKGQFADFRDKFADRNLDNWENPVHDARGNQNHLDRGNYPIWKRADENGVYQYFANVPNTHAIVSALLRGPLLFAQSFLILRNKKQDIAPLFDDKSLSLKCFNDKVEKAAEYNLECKALLTPTAKDIAIARYGQAAVNAPLNSDHIDELLNDEKILPPINKAATDRLKEIGKMPNGKPKDKAYADWIKSTKAAHEAMVKAWKPNAMKAYLKKVNAKAEWKNVLYFDGTEYKPFDLGLVQQVVEATLNRLIESERVDAEAGMADNIRFL